MFPDHRTKREREERLGGLNYQIKKKISPELKNKVPRLKNPMVPRTMILNKSNPLPRIIILKLMNIIVILV